MKRILVTSTDLMMQQFLLPHVQNLRKQGYSVEIACSDVGGKLAQVAAALPGIPVHPVRLRRSPLWPGNVLGFFDLKRRISLGKYDVIWTNEPVMGVAIRLAAVGSGAKVLYLCHGFHFYRGGSSLNWLLFYPIEYALSMLTDSLVTINREDAALAGKMRAKRVAYIHGIGLDTARLENPKGKIREELGLKCDDFLVLSVGELNENKDHATAIRAIVSLGDDRIHYALCGKGPLQKKLQRLAESLGIAEQVHFLGYRRDLAGIFAGADLFVHPSRREGLGLAALEAVYCGLPIVVSDIRGIRDFVPEDCRVPAGDVSAFARAIRENLENPKPISREITKQYRLESVKNELLELLESL